MPVVTRLQARKNKLINEIFINTTPKEKKVKTLIGQEFNDKIKELLRLIETTQERPNKMELVSQTFKIINENIEKLVEREGIDKWIHFIGTVYNKIIYFEAEYEAGSYNTIDKMVVSEFLSDIRKTKNYFVDKISNYSINKLNNEKMQTLETAKVFIAKQLDQTNKFDEVAFVIDFVTNVENLLLEISEEISMSCKVKLGLQLFKMMNDNLKKLIDVGGINKFISFASTLYSKIVEIENVYSSGKFNGINKNLISEFMSELQKPKAYLSVKIQNYDINDLKPHETNKKLIVENAKKLINEQRRPRRLVKPVNYAYMDVIEPESKYDGITNIWADPTIYEDPNYDPNEDEEEDEDDSELEMCDDDYDL